MKPILILLLLAMPLAASAQWTPPDVRDRRATSTVYGDVLSDTAAERYEDALIKCVWYIDNVGPTRGRSILKPWYDLSTKYPPALKKLKEVSDDSKRRLLKGEGKQLDELFLKYTAIQKLISPQTFDSDTVVAFAALDKLSAARCDERVSHCHAGVNSSKRSFTVPKVSGTTRAVRASCTVSA